MKLKECLEMGYACGFKILGECVNNIILHSNVFSYKTTSKEIDELLKEAEIYDVDTPIDAIVDANNWEWYYKDEEDKKYGVQSLREKVIWDFCYKTNEYVEQKNLEQYYRTKQDKENNISTLRERK